MNRVGFRPSSPARIAAMKLAMVGEAPLGSRWLTAPKGIVAAAWVATTRTTVRSGPSVEAASAANRDLPTPAGPAMTQPRLWSAVRTARRSSSRPTRRDGPRSIGSPGRVKRANYLGAAT